MPRFAKIENGVVTNVSIADAGWKPPEGENWIAHEAAHIGWMQSGTDLVPPAVVPAPRTWADHQLVARGALEASDIVVLRCFEAGVPLPAEWKEYRAALRGIAGSASGDPNWPIPTRPPYPATA